MAEDNPKNSGSDPPRRLGLARMGWATLPALGFVGLLFAVGATLVRNQNLGPLASAIEPEHLAVLGCLVIIAGGLFMVVITPRDGESAAEIVERHAAIITFGILIAVVCAFVIGAMILWQVAAEYGGADKRPDLFAVLLTGMTATVAVVGQMTVENRKRRQERNRQRAEEEMRERRRKLEFTHQQIQEFRTDREVQQHKANLRRAYPTGQDIPREEVPLLFARSVDPRSLSAEDSEALHAPVWTSITDLLTFYEQLAADVYRQTIAAGEVTSVERDADRHQNMPGSVDEGLLNEVLSGALIATYKKTLTVIEAHWREDHETYERLRWLINRWQYRLSPEERDFKHAVDPEEWSSKVWTEYGGTMKKKIKIDGISYPLVHGDQKGGAWGGSDYRRLDLTGVAAAWGPGTYRDLALAGLAAWPRDVSAAGLNRKIKEMFPEIAKDADAIFNDRGQDTPAADSGSPIEGVTAALEDLTRAVREIKRT